MSLMVFNLLVLVMLGMWYLLVLVMIRLAL